MDIDSKNEKSLLEKYESLKELHKNKDYFRVVMLSPQLTVEVIDTLVSYSNEWIERKITSHFSEDDNYVFKLIGQLQKKESDRSYIAGALGDAYTGGVWEEHSARSEFVKYFTKLEDLINLRNTYAHEYYTKNISESRAKNCSKSGIDILEFFVRQLEV